MASTTQDRLYELFVAISGEQAPGRSSLADASEELAGSVAKMTSLMQGVQTKQSPSAAPAADGVATNGGAVEVPSGIAVVPLNGVGEAAVSVPAAATTSSEWSPASTANSILTDLFGQIPVVSGIESAQSAASSGGIGGTLESMASTVFKSALGAIPLVSGLLGLFGGGDSPTPPALTKYRMPASLEFQGAETPDGGFTNVDYDQQGMARRYSGTGSTASGTGGSAPSPQITVNVQAMDARSFLDRSADIAAAVRDAMLNLNSINDVVNEL